MLSVIMLNVVAPNISHSSLCLSHVNDDDKQTRTFQPSNFRPKTKQKFKHFLNFVLDSKKLHFYGSVSFYLLSSRLQSFQLNIRNDICKNRTPLQTSQTIKHKLAIRSLLFHPSKAHKHNRTTIYN
jgi:hypothetical protein